MTANVSIAADLVAIFRLGITKSFHLESLKSLLMMISCKSSNKNPNQSQGQSAVRVLAWVLAEELANFGFTGEYLVSDLALVEVEVRF